ncbi:hypothetical protein GVN16_05870 [Emticicia sp. CRIBPO]|uniref:O-antigen ligase family protein n=1 Tax=Emticicia sp. CRIBPO TaxID=2683258 RepID=UPI0014134D2F|nr:O-antigen ligase family protein [Emticicia sp. CRIBPO]NBA85278.1 hypothetical protein [Emticicia sp. CRIBPO]
MIDFFKKNHVLFLFTIIPLGYLVSYILGKLGASSISSYFFLVSILYILYTNTSKWSLYLFFFLFAYLAFNLVFFNEKLTSSAREITPFILYLATLYCSKDLIRNLSKVSQNDLFIFFKYFTVLFVGCFIVTAAIEGKAVYSSFEGTDRFYYNGFVISHQFSYFTILLAFIFLKFKKYLWVILLITMSLIVGNRISYLALAASFIIYLEGNNNIVIRASIKRASLFVFFLLLSMIFYYTFLEPIFNWNNVSNVLMDQDYRNFTSGRSLFWYNGLSEINKNPVLSFKFILGQGPDSVEILANKLYGQYYWMHNDFMQVYFCYGLVGMALYLHALYFFSKVSKSRSIFWFILITAMLNGFYTYGALQLIIMLIIIYKLNVKYIPIKNKI